MIGKRPKQGLIADINITPFTDVILVLLIIFMMTTPLISQLNIKVDLPQAKSGDQVESERQAEADITITREGPVYLDGKLVTRRELRDRMKALYFNNSDLRVILRSDKTVRFQEIVTVLDALNELGISKLNIAATRQE
jgi:biopolymer transport protein TolR